MATVSGHIRQYIKAAHADLPAPAQRSLYDLILSHYQSGAADHPEVISALERYLEAMNAPQLISEPGRSFALQQISYPSQVANRMFFSRGPRVLNDDDYREVRRSIVERLAIEHWPVKELSVAEPEMAQGNLGPPEFSEGEFNCVMSKFFHRDKTYPIIRQTLCDLLETSLSELNKDMDISGLSEKRRHNYRDLFDQRYGNSIRELISEIDKGREEGGLIHFFA